VIQGLTRSPHHLSHEVVAQADTCCQGGVRFRSVGGRYGQEGRGSIPGAQLCMRRRLSHVAHGWAAEVVRRQLPLRSRRGDSFGKCRAVGRAGARPSWERAEAPGVSGAAYRASPARVTPPSPPASSACAPRTNSRIAGAPRRGRPPARSPGALGPCDPTRRSATRPRAARACA
jgi:hypothetical protein